MIGKVNLKWEKAKFPIHREMNTLGIYSAEDFSFLLKKERIRIDRGGSGLALVLFHFSPETKHYLLKNTIKKFRENIREVDYMGWYNRSTIGVLLPQTSYEGALHFCRNFSGVGSNGPAPYNREILTYPGNRHFPPEGHEKKEKKSYSHNLSDQFAKSIPLWKIILDKTGAFAGLILFLPFFIILPFYIKLISPGPVFYSQTRIGYRGKEFQFWKFRTMHMNTDTESHNNHLKELINSDTPMTKLDDKRDPRIIPGGRILRKTCVDELPQIFNILKGDMSLVGPRPCIPYEAEEYLQWHKYRFDINPGLTGLWQVSGKNKLTFKEMIRLDITYSRNMSLGLDLRIITATIPAIIKMSSESLIKKINKSLSEQSVKAKKI